MKDIHLSQTSTRFNRYIHLLSFFQLCKDKLICSDALEKKGNDFGVLRSTHLCSKKKKKKVKTTHSFVSLCVSHTVIRLNVFCFDWMSGKDNFLCGYH